MKEAQFNNDEEHYTNMEAQIVFNPCQYSAFVPTSNDQESILSQNTKSKANLYGKTLGFDQIYVDRKGNEIS